MSQIMPDDTLTFDGVLDPQELLAELRNKEDLFFRLVSLSFNPAIGNNAFGFDARRDVPEPDAADFLKIDLFPEADDDAKCASVKKDFSDFGGNIVADGMLRIRGQDIYAIFFRGPEPESPVPHAASPVLPVPETLPDTIPAHARPVFQTGELGGLPWDRATTVRMPLKGMKGGSMIVFKNDRGGIDAFVMITDADIDTDGPGGSKAIDPTFGPHTSLNFRDGSDCNSRLFPGVVRSRHLLEDPFGLKMGDFAYVIFNGNVVACQIYDQGPDDKIGEISIFTARQVGGLPQNMPEHKAAVAGNFTNELVTLCFPGSSADHLAVSNSEIATKAKSCLAALTARPAGQSVQRVSISGTRVPSGTAAGSGASAQSPLIFTRSDWGALAAKVSTFSRAPGRGIVIHNTQDANRDPLVGDAEKKVAFELSRRIQHSHMFERGWSDVGQHFTISRGGIIMEGRKGTLDATRNHQVVRGAHAGSDLHNRQWWGIEIEGDFRQDPAKITNQQRDALTQLCAWLSTLIPDFDSNQHIKGHREVKPGNGTDCPGKLLDLGNQPDFLSQLRLAMNDASAGSNNATTV
jgi:hypothetical protein